MAVVITSYTPETGPVTGGTVVTVTGTGLDTVTAVLVGDNEAVIQGTPTATSLKFVTPAGDASGDVEVSLFDGTDVVQATDQFSYTAVTGSGSTTLAGKTALDVRNVGDSDWTRVRNVTTIKAGRDISTEDDSDTDSGVDGSDFITSAKNNVTGTVKRVINSQAYDAGQEIIRLAADAAGTPDGTIEARWYDRMGGPEAYTGTAICQWAPSGGNKTADKVDFTLNVQGARTVITNPVIADPSLADGYGS